MPTVRQVRLQKFIAERGVASRRKAEELIAAGKISVNGEVITRLGTSVDPLNDRIEVEGRPAKSEEPKVYIKLNKPRGYVSSCRKQAGEKTILDLVKDIPYRLYPVGRLDKDSEGLMLLTNDGQMANRLMHPRYEHEKEYTVQVQSPMSTVQCRELMAGIIIDGKKTLPAKVKLIDAKIFSITLKEGRKRQIRKMVEAVGNRVSSLKRIRIKNIKLGDLNPGKSASLDQGEIHELLT